MAHIKETRGSQEVSEEVCLSWFVSSCTMESASLRLDLQNGIVPVILAGQEFFLSSKLKLVLVFMVRFKI